MNLFLLISLILVVQGSALDYARSMEAAIRDYSTIHKSKSVLTENVGKVAIGGKEEIKNLPEKEIAEEITISVIDNNSNIRNMSLSEMKATLNSMHKEIMREALLRATHD